MSLNPRSTFLLSILAALLLCGCGRAGESKEIGASALQSVQVSSARIVMPPPGAPMAAGYFELRNPGTTALVLEALESEAFESVEMHETVEENGVSRMRPLANATIAPGETLHFEPGGMHLMLMGSKLAADAPAPPSITMKLRVRAASGGQVREIETPFEVQQAGGSSTDADPHAAHH